MQITINEPIRVASPELALGIVSARVQIRDKDDALRSIMEEEARKVRQELADVDIAQIPRIQALRRLYRGLGKDPTRYRGASEALLRRIVLDKGFYFINTAVDVCNLISIRTRQALGAYDLDRVEGEVSFRPAMAGEVYRGIGRGEFNLEGLPVFSDRVGPFGSPTSDSERTMIRLDSARIAFVLIACTGPATLDAEMTETAALLEQFAAAQEIKMDVIR